MSPADFAALDRAVRTMLPAILKAKGYEQQASTLTALPAITDDVTAEHAADVVDACHIGCRDFDANRAIHWAYVACCHVAFGNDRVRDEFDHWTEALQEMYSAAEHVLPRAEIGRMRQGGQGEMRRSA